VSPLAAVSSASTPLFAAWKHVGRRHQEEELWNVFQRIKSIGTSSGESSLCECVLVKGEAGVGKTSLVSTETLKKWTERHGGYFCSGKFDHLCHPKPHAAVVSAMDMFVDSVLRRGEAEARRVQQNVARALGRDVATLIDMVPSTRTLMDTNSPFPSDAGHGAIAKLSPTVEDPSSSSSLAEAVLIGGGGMSHHHVGSSEALLNRFKYAVRSFLRAASSPAHPLVILLDDVQWADEASLDLLLALLNDSKAHGCVIVATLRTGNGTNGGRINVADCETCTERTARVLSQLQEDRVNLTVLELQNLRREDIESLLSAHLLTEDGDRDRTNDEDFRQRSVSSSRIQALASLLFECTRGNPLLLRENLVHLRDIRLFTYSADRGQWEWDMEEIRVELAVTYREIITKKVMSLPPTAAEMLKTASCLGDALNEEVLARVLLSNSTLASDVQVVATRGLICRDSSTSFSTATAGRYVFSHDEVKMSLYQLIPLEERKSFHSQIGRNLWTNLESDEAGRYMFEVIGQFMLGDSQYASLRERKEIALLFLRAGQRAMAMSSFESAYTFLNRGIECLGYNRWRESYTLTLNLFNAAAEVAYCIGHFSTVECLVEEVLRNARIVEDTYRAQSTRIYALGGGNRMLDAISVGVDLLGTLGVSFPANPTRLHVWMQLKSLKRTLERRYSFESIMRLRVMVDPRALAAAQILNLIFLYATSVKMELAPLIGFRLVRLTLKYGLCPVSCMG
jgi:predicted ATPase